MTNSVQLKGKVLTKDISYEKQGHVFYKSFIEIKRLSDTVDKVPVLYPEFLADKFVVGEDIIVYGSMRTFNTVVEPSVEGKSKSKLELFVYAQNILDETEEESSNLVQVEAVICKEPIVRTTPYGRVICDLILAVHYGNRNKSAYIPSICWGNTLKDNPKLEVGTKVACSGRFQSRPYNKKLPDGTQETRVAYEFSISKLDLITAEGVEE